MPSCLGQQVRVYIPLSCSSHSFSCGFDPNPYLCKLHSIPPVLHVSSGDTITFDCLDASNGQITASSTLSALDTLVFAALDQVNGPVHIADAQPGDTLRIDVLDVQVAEWGWSAILPGFGLLSDEYATPVLKIWTLHRNEGEGEGYGYAWFDEAKGIKIPLRPFAGEMGVAPGKDGAHSTIPPYKTGGNVDTRHLSKGSTLYLPVEVPGALFSIGVSGACLLWFVNGS